MRDYVALTLRGNHYAIGWQHGRQVRKLRPRIAEAMDACFRRVERDGSDARFEALLRETREALEVFDPPLLSMIRGQAEALEFDFGALLRYDLMIYLRDALTARRASAIEGCTTWAATGSATADGRPILAKNRDYRPEHLSLQVVIAVTPQGGHRYVCSGSAGSPGVFCAGISQVGLVVADTHVCSTDLGPGLPDYALMMHILEEHDSVSSALDYLRSVPRMGRNNLILADAQGHLAVFECGHRGCGLLETYDGVLVNTNHFVSPEMRNCFVEVEPPRARGRSFRRYERVTGALNDAWGRVDIPFTRRLMATHDGSLASICCHPDADSDLSTISTSIFLPVQRTLLFCHGLPCQDRYDVFVV